VEDHRNILILAPTVPLDAAEGQGDEMFAKWRQTLLAGGFQPPDQYQAPALGGTLTLAGWYKSTRTAVVLAIPTPAQAAALLDKGYTVVDMSDPSKWTALFDQHPQIFGGVT
jgi:hypothetical protein